MTADRAVVIGVGNEFRRDDGIGPAVLAELARRELPGVRLVHSDGEPSQLFDAWAGTPLAVLVDAVRCAPSSPGRIHRSTLSAPLAAAAASTHGLGIPEALRLAEVLDRAPQRLVVYAVEAGDLGFGPGLSDAVARALTEVVAAVLAELSAPVPATAAQSGTTPGQVAG
jgi:hydrogenase maturation protease